MSTLITKEPASGWPSTSLRPFFLYDTNHPASIEASVVAANSESQTFIVTCPSPCASSDFPEQTITHVSGSSWAGERTWEGVTTSWGCNLGSGGSDTIPDQNGECNATTINGGDIRGVIREKAVNSCFVAARSVPAYITGGMDKMYDIYPYYASSIDAEGWISFKSEDLASMGCSVATTEEITEVEATTTKPSAPESTAEDSKSTATAGTASQTEAKTAGESDETTPAAPTQTGEDAPSGSFRTPISLVALVGQPHIA
ncbi:hypothetical protein G7Z17_g12353 [Cylindrodendrum hubeiense]|uniref:Uncharacterized protein n=1 Tax=Cylindrodendrum hubeiense TaxID=595255 RepID=A0A9P5LAQ2_9HYPO|nr:hypothetical protein G7Z17_g12353 [Cylindrodendrum hubeiense]